MAAELRSRPSRFEMSYRDQWRALSAHIHGLMQASEHHVALLALHDLDSYGRWKTLRDHCVRILEALQAFQAAYRDTKAWRPSEFLATSLTRRRPNWPILCCSPS
jgi:hypothetical protein